MEQVVSLFDRRLDPSPLTALVAVGDVVLIGLFVAVGEINHGTPPWEYPLWALETFATFLIGWVLVAFVGGLYTRDAWQFPLRAISWTTPAWITAVLIAMAIRATPLVHGGVQLTFVVVSMAVGLVLLLPWRSAVAYYDSR
ncbi:DUF3054 domain-containing protein [Halapricum salinum]|uniref:DUF3054 domain-containing protein n=1 Tax=Halapricum salinum TaxID=1457250 RepID=A0A4D6HFD7_9EURY|nr:DUF3054 domain-containing protein [Halapricum salinum]QCC52510.1 DUF3054 domain-containing protein [Halapricum salinum]